MLYNLNRQSWVKEITNFRTLLLNEQTEIVDSITTTYKCRCEYFIFKRKDKTIMSFIAFVNGTKIFQPIHFFYAAFWVDDDLSDRVYTDSLYELIGELKKKYTDINLTLPIEIKDIRPFLWHGFEVNNRFTYLKNTNETQYGKYMERKLAKGQDLKLRFAEEKMNNKSLSLNLQLLSDLKFRKSKIADIGRLLTLLSDTKYLFCFNTYENDKLILSDIVFKDEENKKVYEVLKNKVAGSDNIPSISYHQLFEFYANAGYNWVDLMGADMPSISKFKAGFNPLLTTHFLVKYNWTNDLKNKLKLRITEMIRSLIKKF